MPTLRKLLTAKVVTPIGYILHMDTTYVFSTKAVDREGPKLPFFQPPRLRFFFFSRCIYYLLLKEIGLSKAEKAVFSNLSSAIIQTLRSLGAQGLFQKRKIGNSAVVAIGLLGPPLRLCSMQWQKPRFNFNVLFVTTEDDFKEFHRTRTRHLGRTKVILISPTTLFKAYSVPKMRMKRQLLEGQQNETNTTFMTFFDWREVVHEGPALSTERIILQWSSMAWKLVICASHDIMMWDMCILLGQNCPCIYYTILH